MKTIIPILALALAACSSPGETKVTLEQTRMASEVRSAWQKELRPVRVTTDIQVPGKIGVMISNAEGKLFLPFSFDGTAYTAGEHGFAVDTASTVKVCWPEVSADIAILHAPFSERLHAGEVARNVESAINLKVKFSSAMALLRFNLGSGNIKDVFNSLTLKGPEIATKGKYDAYEGKWIETDGKGMAIRLGAECLLNNGRNHDFYLVPVDVDQDISLVAVVNGEEKVFTTKIPPIAAGSMTQINLELGKQLTAKSSWVDNERKIEIATVEGLDSVCVGNYLRRDGLVVAKRDTMSVAVVIETDGKHGKAVAIEDWPDQCSFGHKSLSSGRLFSTIDGQRKEGIINNPEVSADEELIYKPSMPYPDTCAFGYDDGAELTQQLKASIIRYDDDSAFAATDREPCSYVPSLAEMARLYYLFQPYSKSTVGEQIEPLSDEYLTCSESTENTLYGIDMSKGIVMCNYSKQYARMKLRLFYLF